MPAKCKMSKRGGDRMSKRTAGRPSGGVSGYRASVVSRSLRARLAEAESHEPLPDIEDRIERLSKRAAAELPLFDD